MLAKLAYRSSGALPSNDIAKEEGMALTVTCLSVKR